MLSLFYSNKKEDVVVSYTITIKTSFITSFKVWLNNYTNNTPRIMHIYGNLFTYETCRTIKILDNNKLKFKLFINNKNMLSGQKAFVEIYNENKFIASKTITLDERKLNTGWILFEESFDKFGK
jgi:hypothetical protein